MTPHGGEPPGSQGRGTASPAAPLKPRPWWAAHVPLFPGAGRARGSESPWGAGADCVLGYRGWPGVRLPGEKCLPGPCGGPATGTAAVIPDMLLSGRISNLRPQPTTLPRPRRAPATGGGPRIIGRVSRKRVWLAAAPPGPASALAAASILSVETGGGGRLRRWGGQQLALRCSWASPVPCLVSPWKGTGASKPSRSRRRRSPGLEVGEWRRRAGCGHVGGGAPYCWGKEARSEAGGRGRPGGAGSRAGLEERGATWKPNSVAEDPNFPGSLWEWLRVS